MTAGVQHKTHCTKSLGTLSQSCQLKNAEKPSKIQVPSASQGTTLQAGLSKESNLRSALQLLSVQLLYLLWPSGPGLCCCWTSRKPTLLLIGSEHWGNPEAPSGLGAHVSGSLLCAVVLLLFWALPGMRQPRTLWSLILPKCTCWACCCPSSTPGMWPGRHLSCRNPPISKGVSCHSAMLFSLFKDFLFFFKPGTAGAKMIKEGETGRVPSFPPSLLSNLFSCIWQLRQLLVGMVGRKCTHRGWLARRTNGLDFPWPWFPPTLLSSLEPSLPGLGPFRVHFEALFTHPFIFWEQRSLGRWLPFKAHRKKCANGIHVL